MSDQTQTPAAPATAAAAIAAMRNVTIQPEGTGPALSRESRQPLNRKQARALRKAQRAEAAAKAPAVKPSRKAAGKKAVKVRDPNQPRLHKIRGEVHDISHYVKYSRPDGSKSLDCSDSLARELRGLELADVYERAAEVLEVTVKELTAKYGHLNHGMQRMNLGNRIRAAETRAEAKAAGK